MEKIKEYLDNAESFRVLNINYHKRNGVFWSDVLTESMLEEDFYKIYIFNNSFMMTLYKLNNQLKYDLVEEKEFIGYKMKKIYLTEEEGKNEYKVINYRVGEDKNKNIKIQYISVE